MLKVRDSKRGRNEFVAVIYGEFDRPAVNVYVDKRRMLLTINRWRQQVNGPMFVIGDQNIHAGSAQMEQWNSTLCTARMDTGPVPSYIRLDQNRGGDSEVTSTTDHVLQPVSTQGKPRSALIRRPKVVCVDLGIETQDHYPVVMDTNISAPARQQRCKSKIVSRIGGATTQQIDGLQAQLRASFVPVSAAVRAMPRDPSGINQKLEAVLGWWLEAHDARIGYKKVGGLESVDGKARPGMTPEILGHLKARR